MASRKKIILQGIHVIVYKKAVYNKTNFSDKDKSVNTVQGNDHWQLSNSYASNKHTAQAKCSVSTAKQEASLVNMQQ
jgi:hypothetical protein